MHHEYTVLKTPVVAEMMNRMLVEIVRAMLSDSKMSKNFWAEALLISTYIRNRSSTNKVQRMTPYETKM